MARQTIKKDEESNKKNIENNKIENIQVDENNANDDNLNNFVKENEELKLKLSQMAQLISQLTSKKTEPKNEDEYSKIDDEVTENSKTGDILILIAWMVGIGALGYTVYCFKNKKEN